MFNFRASDHWKLGIIFLMCWICCLPGEGLSQEMQDVQRLEFGINTDEFDEASPLVSLDGRYLYFTRTGSPDFDRTLIVDGEDISGQLSESAYRRKLSQVYSQIAGHPVRDPYLSGFNQDIFVARCIEGVFDTVMHPGPPLNNALPNSVLSVAADTTSMVILNQFFENGSMYEGFSTVERDSMGGYSYPRPLHIYDLQNLSGDVNLAMNLYGTVMVLSLEREDSKGSNDLYVSFKVSEDLWSEPVSLGDDINTEFVETTPFITRDGRHLYFASDRPGSAGGMDIWMSSRLDYTWKKWSAPRRLIEPINSQYDDAQACVDEVGNYIYFASRREGSSDIFRVSLLPKPRLSKPIRIKGRIVDGDTGNPLRAEMYYGPESLEGYLEYFHTYTGIFEIELYEYELYKFFARKPGYQPARLMYDARLADMQESPVHYMVLKLYKAKPIATDSLLVTETPTTTLPVAEQLRELEVGQRLSFHNIYFKQSEAVVLDQSYAALDEFVTGMQENPGISVRIEGHTDNVGSEADLMKLSWDRAEAIKNYLVENGIDSDRVTTQGFGPSQPVVDNTNEFNRRRNRRVEVRIIAKD